MEKTNLYIQVIASPLKANFFELPLRHIARYFQYYRRVWHILKNGAFRGISQNLTLEPIKYSYDPDEPNHNPDPAISYKYFAKRSNEPGLKNVWQVVTFFSLRFCITDFPRGKDGHLFFYSSALVELRSYRPTSDLALGGWYGTGQGPLNHFHGNLEIKVASFLHVDMVRCKDIFVVYYNIKKSQFPDRNII